MRGPGGRRTLACGALLAVVVLVAACSANSEPDDERSDASDTTSGAEAGVSSTTDRDVAERFGLENGLEVILYPVPDAENTAVMVAYDIGEIHDPPQQSGLAHVSEQVYSTAAAGPLPATTADASRAAHPLGWDSRTGDDFTVVSRVVPDDELTMELEQTAFRMAGVQPTQEDLDREKARALADIDRNLAADPDAAARNRVEELIQPSPNGGNEGGIPAQVLRLELQTVIDRLNGLYKPTNATLVVVGGFSVEPVRDSIEEYFGPIEPGTQAGDGAPWGLAGFGELASATVAAREGVTPADSTVAIGFLARAPGSPTYPAFLVHVSRLWQAAADADVTVSYAPLNTPGVITLSAPLLEGETEQAAVERLRGWLGDRLAEPVDESDLETAMADYAILFGLGGFPEGLVVDGPDRVAFSLARVDQIDIDTEALTVAIPEVTDRDLDESVQATFQPEGSAAAIVLVEG